MKKTVCYKCADRCVGCHSTCETYQAFSRENAERNENKYRARYNSCDAAAVRHIAMEDKARGFVNAH